MSDFITLSLFASMLHLAIPVILPMLGGAFRAVAFSYLTGNPWLGLLGAVFTGTLAGGLLAVMSVSLRGDQVIGSTAINLIGAGLTAALVPIIWGIDSTTPSVPKVPTPPLPLVGPDAHRYGAASARLWRERRGCRCRRD
ncbi:ABC transporter permease subunit [Celeribacter persicus]|uniref:Branched-subunit amino acid transport system permease n=1 Tax=Celeribacter persicus TaxID=1651082 RepID=A0A2T5GL48_9RHOB|nr:hypothetical protein [Celeribacter persicus]PTQ60048.1 branched-subunit amino acid transport system permease [Celeribacter persicus]